MTDVEAEVPQRVKYSGDDGWRLVSLLCEHEQEIDVRIGSHFSAPVPAQSHEGVQPAIIIGQRRSVGVEDNHIDRISYG